MDFRTDLTLERRNMAGENIEGVSVSEQENEGVKTTVIDITSPVAAQRLSKGMGKYITLEMESFAHSAPASSERLDALVKSIKTLVGDEGTVLVVGVGNGDMTADALGPLTAGNIFVTRHIDEELQREMGFCQKLRSVCAVSTSVLGKTGIESCEYIESLCRKIKPQWVITVDALAAGSVKRLGTTVQMSNTGISPGSGIGNARKRIDEKLLGVPVIAIGVPTVVDTLNLVKEYSGLSDETLEKSSEEFQPLIVAPKDIDVLVKNAAYLIALALNCALQPSISPEEMYELM